MKQENSTGQIIKILEMIAKTNKEIALLLERLTRPVILLNTKDIKK